MLRQLEIHGAVSATIDTLDPRLALPTLIFSKHSSRNS